VSTRTEDEYLAAFLARKVFEGPAGANPNDVQRIAYRGCVVGSSGAERDYGGSNEQSLTDILREALKVFRDHEHVYEDDIVHGPNVVGYACSICGLERDDD
jgi:hypothetical protein